MRHGGPKVGPQMVLSDFTARRATRAWGVAALLVAGLLAVAPAAGWAKPPPHATATPDDQRAYFSSGAYLSDVANAVAPAKAFVAARMDQIDEQRSVCVKAGFALGTGAVAPSPTVTASGRTTITFKRSLVRGGRIRLTATGATVSRKRRIALPVTAATVTDRTARVTQRGTLVIHRGKRRVVLRGLEVRLSRTSVSISARISGRRVTVLKSVAGTKRRPRLSGVAASAAAKAVPLRLTRVGARKLRKTGLHAGRVGSVTIAAFAGFRASAASCRAVPSKPAMVLDIDETALSAYLAGGDPGGGSAGQAPELAGTAVALPPVLDLYRYALARGVAIDFITARIAPQALNTGSNLDAQGYGNRIGITFRNSTSDDPGQYKHDARQALQDQQGYSIIANVGDQCSDLYDGQAERSFKLPNTFYITAGKQDASCDQDG